MSVSLRDVVLAVSYGDASLVGESAGYLILGAADIALRTCELGGLDSITIDEEGSVHLNGPPVEEYESERVLRGLLGTLLGKVRIPSNNLARVAARRDLRGLRGLVAELEAALVPVNRRAARRTLARLCREAQKSAAREHAFAEVEEVPVREATLAGSEEPVPEPSFEPSPEPEPVQNAPSPVPVATHAAISTARAEHVVTDPPRRISQLPTVPAKADSALLERVASSYGARTPAELAPVVWERLSKDTFNAGTQGAVEFSAEGFEAADEDDFDGAETHVFAGVAPIDDAEFRREIPLEGDRAASEYKETAAQHQAAPARVALVQPASAIEQTAAIGSQVLVNPKLANVAAAPRRRHTASSRPRRVLSDDESLIVMSESAPRRTASDISDLLDKMSISATSTENLYLGLKSLSRIDLSPVAPPVGATWIDDERR